MTCIMSSIPVHCPFKLLNFSGKSSCTIISLKDARYELCGFYSVGFTVALSQRVSMKIVKFIINTFVY